MPGLRVDPGFLFAYIKNIVYVYVKIIKKKTLSGNCINGFIMKTFVLTVSRVFPKTHKQAGNPTRFIEKILNKEPENWTKIHTIRANYDLWKNRIDKVNEGKAVLSLRYWTGSPYNYKRDGSKQFEFLRLDKNSGVGVQKIKINKYVDLFIDDKQFDLFQVNILSKNDGLTDEDFQDWFKDYDLSKPLAIIHFTGFRY